MAKQIALEIELNGDKQVLRSMNDMNDAAEQLRMQMEAATDPEDIRRFGRELQKVEGHVKDIELQFESLDMEQRMTAATDVVAGLAGGFAAVEGAIAIAGVESEAFEETMTKVMGAMAFAQGIKDMGTAAVAMKKLTDVTNIQAAAQKVLNFVMSANPIGLIVTAIGLLIAGIVAFQKPIQNAIAKFESLNGIAKVLIGILAGPLLAAIYGVTKALEFFGVIESEAERAAEAQKRAAEKARSAAINAEREKTNAVLNAEKEKRSAREDSYDFEIAKLQAAGEATFEIEQEKLQYVIDSIARQKELLREQIEFEKKVIEEREATHKNSLQSMVDFDYQMAQARIENKSEELEQITEEQKTAEETITLNQIREDKRRRDAARKAQEERDKAAEERAKKEEEEREARIQALKDEYARMMEVEKEFRKEQQRIRDEEQKKREEGAKMQQEFYSSLAAMGQEEAEKKVAAQEELLTRMNEARLRYEVGVVSTLQNVAKIIGEESEKGAKLAKAAAIIQVLIDTAKALSSAIAGAVAAASLTGPAAPFVMGSYIVAGIATVTGAFAQVKSILAKADANMPSLGSATAGATGGARINPVQSGSTQIDANGNSIQDTQEMKVHVVESEISEVQGRVSVIENQASAR